LTSQKISNDDGDWNKVREPFSQDLSSRIEKNIFFGTPSYWIRNRQIREVSTEEEVSGYAKSDGVSTSCWCWTE